MNDCKRFLFIHSFPTDSRRRCTVGGWCCTPYAACSAQIFVFWCRKTYTQVIDCANSLFIGRFSAASLESGAFFSLRIWHLCAQPVQYMRNRQTELNKRAHYCDWQMNAHCCLGLKKKSHNRVCVNISLHVCAFLSSRGSDLALSRLRKLRLKWDLGFFREIISR